MTREWGTLVPRKSGYRVRFWETVDGVEIKRTVNLGTKDEQVANRKIELLKQGQLKREDAASPETFAMAAERVHAMRKSDGVVCADDEFGRLRLYAIPAIGGRSVGEVSATDINRVLDAAKAAGKSRQTVAHLKQAVRVVFDQLVREGVCSANPAEAASMPAFRAKVKKERAVLTDPEFAVYLAWEHPVERHRLEILERQTMSCISRMWGGLRTNDLHRGLRWESSFQIGDGEFLHGYAPRIKTRRPQLMEIPEMLRPILRDWWERHGRPTEGLVFPVRRGKRAGEAKSKSSQARAFKRDLRRAFGIERWDAERGKFVEARSMTPRERELFEETEYTLPVDFHSWRRAFDQAAAEAGLAGPQIQALDGRSSLSSLETYLRRGGKLQRIPEAVLPDLKIVPQGTRSRDVMVNNEGEPQRIVPLDSRRIADMVITVGAQSGLSRRRPRVQVPSAAPESLADSATYNDRENPAENPRDAVPVPTEDGSSRTELVSLSLTLRTIDRGGQLSCTAALLRMLARTP